MSLRAWQERIQDILDAIAEMDNFVEGMSLSDFLADVKTQRAVELNFIIIGEAAAQISDEIQENNPEVPWHLMRGMRNRLVHIYFSVDPKLLWDTVKNDLPTLRQTLINLLEG
jgi:uncharacterized protein with HEPN domain